MKIIGLFKKLLLLISCFTIAMVVHASSDNLILDSSHGGDGSAWGVAQCDSCHMLNFIHENTQSTVRNLVQEKGYVSCAGCHGTNGTTISQPCVICHNSSDLPFASRQKGGKTHNFISPQAHSSSGLTDDNCKSCHSASNMNGIFEPAIDLTLFADQYGNKSPYKHSNDFCLACHNRDHQQPGFEIPQNDYRDPLTAIEDNYHYIDIHGIAKGTGQRTFSGLRENYHYPAIVACTDCHAMHGTHNDKLIIANAFNGASRLSREIKEQDISIDTANGAYAQLCVVCHSMDLLEDQGDIDTGNGLSGVHQSSGSCIECHRHGMAAQTGL